jgi:hypothetical protein
MADVTAKQTVLFFQDVDGRGWSERYWYTGTTLDPQFTVNISQLVGARAGLLNASAKITHVRVDSIQKRVPFIFSLASGGTPGSQVPPSMPSDVCLLVRMVAGTSEPYANKAFLRGIPQRIVAAEEYFPDLAWTNSFNNYVAVLQGGNWAIVSSLDGVPTSPQDISVLTPTSPRGFTFVGPANVFTAKQVVRIRHTKVVGYAGLKTIVSVNAAGTTYTCGGVAPASVDTGAAPTAQLYNYGQEPMGNVFVEGVSNRRTGRPFGVSPGRRPTVVPLRQ